MDPGGSLTQILTNCHRQHLLSIATSSNSSSSPSDQITQFASSQSAEISKNHYNYQIKRPPPHHQHHYIDMNIKCEVSLPISSKGPRWSAIKLCCKVGKGLKVEKLPIKMKTSGALRDRTLHRRGMYQEIRPSRAISID